MTNGITARLLLGNELTRLLTITGQGTYVVETDDDGKTWLILTSTDPEE